MVPSSFAGGIEAAGQHQEVTGANANPIRRVVSLLQGMAKKVQAEGEKEKELYDKFMCYCKNSGGELSKSISDAEDKVSSLPAEVQEAEASLVQAKEDLKSAQV